ncbi:MAG: hypothetical protein RI907_2485 [Pseudomonadota bacterium]
MAVAVWLPPPGAWAQTAGHSGGLRTVATRPGPVSGHVGVERVQPPGQSVSSAREVPAPKDWQDLPAAAPEAPAAVAKAAPQAMPKEAAEASPKLARKAAPKVALKSAPTQTAKAAKAAMAAKVTRAGKAAKAAQAPKTAKATVVKPAPAAKLAKGQAKAQVSTRVGTVGRVRNGQVVQELADPNAPRPARHRAAAAAKPPLKPVPQAHAKATPKAASKAPAKPLHAAPHPSTGKGGAKAAPQGRDEASRNGRRHG